MCKSFCWPFNFLLRKGQRRLPLNLAGQRKLVQDGTLFASGGQRPRLDHHGSSRVPSARPGHLASTLQNSAAAAALRVTPGSAGCGAAGSRGPSALRPWASSSCRPSRPARPGRGRRPRATGLQPRWRGPRLFNGPRRWQLRGATLPVLRSSRRLERRFLCVHAMARSPWPWLALETLRNGQRELGGGGEVSI